MAYIRFFAGIGASVRAVSAPASWRAGILLLASAWCLGGANDAGLGAIAPSPKRANVIWIVLDACRARNLGCYGYERPTSPNIDRIAARGVVFEQNYAQSHWTGRSVPSYMTGRYFPVSCLDLKGANCVRRVPPPKEQLLPEIMGQSGYHTALITAHKAYFRPSCRLWKAFDEAIGVESSRAKSPIASFEDINATLLPWLEKPPAQPFFLYIHAIDTHFPHTLDPPYDQWVSPEYSPDHLQGDAIGQVLIRKDRQPFSDADKQYFRALHDGSILYADTQLGRLFDKLVERELLENTLIIIGADHGDALGEDGRAFGHNKRAGTADEIFHVPLVMAGSGLPTGRRVTSLTENVDIVPTLIELLGLASDAEVDGKDLLPLTRNENAPPLHEYVFFKHGGNSYESIRAFVLRNNRHKYEVELDTMRETLWRVPDRLENRADLTGQDPEAASRAKRRMVRNIMPRWRQYKDLAVSEIVLAASYIAKTGKPSKAIVHRSVPTAERFDLYTDDKWAYADGQLWSCGWLENAPPITFGFPVSHGQYKVQMAILSNSDYEGRPASSFQVKIEDDPAFRKVVADSLPPETSRYELIDMGEYNVSDGAFSVTLDEGDRDHWAYLSMFRLIPARDGLPSERPGPDAEPSSVQDLVEREEQLRALGYVD